MFKWKNKLGDKKCQKEVWKQKEPLEKVVVENHPVFLVSAGIARVF